MGLTERAFAPVQLTQKQAEELLRIADMTRGRLTPRDMPEASPDLIRKVRGMFADVTFSSDDLSKEKAEEDDGA